MKLTIKRASEIMGCSYTWAYKLFKEGRIQLNMRSVRAYANNKRGKGRPSKYKG